MTVDPFAAPAPEEAQQPELNVHKSGPLGTAVPATAATNITFPAPVPEGKVTVTFKGGTGFDAPWIVIHATDLQDAYNQTTGENATLLASVMSQVQKAGAHFASNGPVNTGRGGNTGGASSAPQGATEAPSWAPAKHQPDAVYKTGVSKAGKVWHAWMAPEKGGYDPKFFYQN